MTPFISKLSYSGKRQDIKQDIITITGAKVSIENKLRQASVENKTCYATFVDLNIKLRTF